MSDPTENEEGELSNEYKVEQRNPEQFCFQFFNLGHKRKLIEIMEVLLWKNCAKNAKNFKYLLFSKELFISINEDLRKKIFFRAFW